MQLQRLLARGLVHVWDQPDGRSSGSELSDLIAADRHFLFARRLSHSLGMIMTAEQQQTARFVHFFRFSLKLERRIGETVNRKI